jgi:hypothetical protein
VKPDLRAIAFRLSRSDILFWTLPLLMVILAVGTIAQKSVGLFAAQHAYFESWLTFIGPVPFPGGATLMVILFVNMLMKFLIFSEWQWRKSGIILTHFGILILLLGGFVTAATTREYYMVIGQGEKSDRMEDYYQRVLTVSKDGSLVFSLPHQQIKAGMQIADTSFPFKISIDTYCFNCRIERRAEGQDKFGGPGRFMQLVPAKELPKNEENLTGIEFSVSGTDKDARYVTFDKFPKPEIFKIDGHEYKVEIARAVAQLPFTLQLDKFTMQNHPGVDTAKSYQSDITVNDAGNSWQYRIEMNEPLRYRGLTFYQSSFDLSGDRPFTVLNVVENSGRLFPYVSTFIIAVGLMLHIVLLLVQRRKK